MPAPVVPVAVVDSVVPDCVVVSEAIVELDVVVSVSVALVVAEGSDAGSVPATLVEVVVSVVLVSAVELVEGVVPVEAVDPYVESVADDGLVVSDDAVELDCC